MEYKTIYGIHLTSEYDYLPIECIEFWEDEAKAKTRLDELNNELWAKRSKIDKEQIRENIPGTWINNGNSIIPGDKNTKAKFNKEVNKILSHAKDIFYKIEEFKLYI